MRSACSSASLPRSGSFADLSLMCRGVGDAIASGVYKTVILDELNPTVDLELLEVNPIAQILMRKPPDTEVIITGHCLNQPTYFELASVHSEMICHKHYAERGVDLTRGVDF